MKCNVVLLMCDQFRGDCLSYVGHPDVKTPYLDTLASQGICFTDAHSACPSCIPARAALFTGKSQVNHKRVGYQDGIDWKYNHMMAEIFQEEGYQTACIGKMHVHPPRLSCGFQTLKLHDGYIGYYRRADIPHWQHQTVSDDYLYELKKQVGVDADVNKTGIENNSWTTHPWIYDEYLHPTNWVVDESIHFLEKRDRTRPFFMMSSFVRPHPPFDAPENYYHIYKDRIKHQPLKGDWNKDEITKQFGFQHDSLFGCQDQELQKDAMAGYYACITHVDHQIGRLITALENDGTLEDTIIVFISDHGEMLFDHGFFRKMFPYEGSTHIPCIMRIGKNIQKIKPMKTDDLIEIRDILPTLLDYAGIDIPKDIDGISLKKHIDSSKQTREYLHGEHSGSLLSNHYILTKTGKYIWYSQLGIEQFFDRTIDKDELHDCIHDDAYQEEVKHYRKILIKELKDREEGYSNGEKLLKGMPVNFLKR